MRRIAYMLAVMLLVVSIIFVACAKPAAPKALSLGTSSAGQRLFILATLMSDIWAKYADISVSVEPVGGSDASIRAAHEGKVDMGIVNGYALLLGYKGEKQFAGEGKAPLPLMLGGGLSARPLIARANAGINSPADLRGKRINVRRKALGDLEEAFMVILKVYGISKEEVTILEHSNTTEQVESLVIGAADAILCPFGSPVTGSPAYLKAAEEMDIVIVPMSKAKRDQVLEELPAAFLPTVIPAGVLRGQEQDVNTIAIPVAAFCHTDVPEETVYQLVKAFFAHFDEFKAGHASAKYWTLESTLSPPGVPWHPGTIKYLKEIGAWTSELDKIQQQRL